MQSLAMTISGVLQLTFLRHQKAAVMAEILLISVTLPLGASDSLILGNYALIVLNQT